MGLVAWYPLNGDTLDWSGNGLHGIGSNIVENSAGKIGKTYNFNGINSIITLPPIDLLTKGTIALWAKSANDFPSATTSTVFRSIIGKVGGGGGGQQSYYLDWRGTSTTRILRFGLGGSSGADTIEIGNRDLNQWTHLIGIFDENTLGLYVNGVLVVKKNRTHTTSSLGTNVRIGSFFGAWEGSFNDVRLYDHALSLKEIKEIAKAKVLHYGFDDPQATTVRDQSGYGNDGVIIPATAPTWTNDSVIGAGAYSFKNSTIETEFLLNTQPIATVSFWFYIDKWPAENEVLYSTPFGLGFGFYTPVNNFIISSSIHTKTVSFNNIKLKAWNHVAIKYNDNFGNPNAFLNNVEGTYGGMNYWTNVSTKMLVGCRVPSGTTQSSHFNGKIDDLRIYATALSDEDILELYKNRASMDDQGNFFVNEIDEINSTTKNLNDKGIMTTNSIYEVDPASTDTNIIPLAPNKMSIDSTGNLFVNEIKEV